MIGLANQNHLFQSYHELANYPKCTDKSFILAHQPPPRTHCRIYTIRRNSWTPFNWRTFSSYEIPKQPIKKDTISLFKSWLNTCALLYTCIFSNHLVHYVKRTFFQHVSLIFFYWISLDGYWYRELNDENFTF